MSIDQRFVSEIDRFLAMKPEELRSHLAQGGVRTIPLISLEKFEGEPMQIDDDGLITPTAAYTKFINSQPEAGLTNLLADPLNPQFWYAAGATFINQEMIEKARDCFHYAAKLKPDYGDAWYNFGESSFAHLDDAVNGRLGYTKAIECNPRDGDAMYNMGLIELGERNFAAAEDYFRRAMAIRPDQGQANYWLCITLFYANKLDDMAEARKGLARHFQASAKLTMDLDTLKNGKTPDGKFFPK